MKTLLKLTSLLMCIVLHCGLQGCKMNSSKESLKDKNDTVKEQLYYGVSAQEILALEGEQMKAFLEKHRIKSMDWFELRTELRKKEIENEIDQLKSETDSIYDRVDKELGIKK